MLLLLQLFLLDFFYLLAKIAIIFEISNKNSVFFQKKEKYFGCFKQKVYLCCN